MSEPLTIRKAGLRDAETIAAFNCRMADETEGKRLDPPTVLTGVKAVLKDPHKGFYLLAETKGASARVVAQLLVTYEWSDWRNKNFWWIQSVYVDPCHRGQRAFSSLLRHLRDMARFEKHVAGMRLYVDRGNANARQIYEYLGFAPSAYLLYESEF